jgi:hypothetical protein
VTSSPSAALASYPGTTVEGAVMAGRAIVLARGARVMPSFTRAK